jgi:hypothetical protein
MPDAINHPLDYWLSPELANVSPPEAPSGLRQPAVWRDPHGNAGYGPL